VTTQADVDPRRFRDTLALWPSGVTVVTARDARGPVGITAASFSSLSLNPPLVLVCIDHGARSHDGLVTAGGFVVHVLSRAQEHLSVRFAQPGPEKFDGVDLAEGPFGAPVLPLGTARLVCAHHEALEGGDHTILIGRVLDVETSDEEPLVYWNRTYRSAVA
jgi:flavin reductase (DIM6/NTAB) family NADH-FMN oxidoreductase RutF